MIAPAPRRSLARNRLRRGRASDFIMHGVKAGDKVVVTVRVSTHMQEHTANLDAQIANLLSYCQNVGASVVAVVRHVGSGTDPSWLLRAARIARGHGAVLLAESTNRFSRHPGYHSVVAPHLQARPCDLETLRDWTLDVSLATVLDPDASPGEERSYQTKRGLAFKVKGEGPTKARRRKLTPAVVELFKHGNSKRSIARQLGLGEQTVRNWLKRESSQQT